MRNPGINGIPDCKMFFPLLRVASPSEGVLVAGLMVGWSSLNKMCTLLPLFLKAFLSVAEWLHPITFVYRHYGNSLQWVVVTAAQTCISTYMCEQLCWNLSDLDLSEENGPQVSASSQWKTSTIGTLLKLLISWLSKPQMNGILECSLMGRQASWNAAPWRQASMQVIR